ncbi:MAG: acyl-CoA dehydrogenase family protein [Gemmatimonadetes bacterium]|nr:acyl-CoA dehydrogenase family protein [Gemmatimonadota bacterium]
MPPAAAPSFLRQLFAGAIAGDLLFPYPPPLDRRHPDEAATVRRLAEALNGMVAAGVIDSRRFDEAEQVDEAAIAAFAEAGLLGIGIPREYGGLGLSASGYARVFGAVAAVDPSLAVLVGVHCGLGGKALVLFGSEMLKQRYLPALARGETLAAYALTEPETGSDAQHIVTRAERDPEGRGWLLTGRKHWIGNGHRAGVLVTFAQTPVERQGKTVSRPTAFVIRPDFPGFRVAGTIRKLGIRGSTQAELVFDRMLVPDDHVLGEVGKGFRVAVHALNAGRLSLAAGCAAAGKRLLGEFTRYAEARVQFGAPLATFEVTQRKMATMAAETYAADAMVGVLAAGLDDPQVDVSLEAACAKVFASEMAWRAADEMVQLAGGRGYVQPWPYERYLRDARIQRIFEGANEVLRLFVGLNGVQGPAAELQELAQALRRPFTHLGTVTSYAAERVAQALGRRPSLGVPLHEALARHGARFERDAAALAAAAEQVVLAHRREVVHRQLVVERLADLAIELYARAATLARTQRLIEERGVAACGHEVALTELFCTQSARRFRAVHRELRRPSGAALDRLRVAVAAQVRERAGYAPSDALLDVPLPAAPAWGLSRQAQERALGLPSTE